MELVITEHEHDEQFADFLVGRYINVTCHNLDGTNDVFDMKVLGHRTDETRGGFVQLWGDLVDMDDPDVVKVGEAYPLLVNIKRLEIY
jgi:hypothetical protein